LPILEILGQVIPKRIRPNLIAPPKRKEVVFIDRSPQESPIKLSPKAYLESEIGPNDPNGYGSESD
jgi:hypothetical protein